MSFWFDVYLFWLKILMGRKAANGYKEQKKNQSLKSVSDAVF